MVSLTAKMMAGSLPPVTVTGSNAKLPPPTLPLQVKVKESQMLEASEKPSMNVSRRNLALYLTATSFSAVTLLSPKPAEARMSKAEMKKMILEKFKILREKVGLAKPEPETNDKIASPTPSVPENKLPPPSPPIPKNKVHVPPEPSLPRIQNDKKIVVEAAPLP
uniref:uncharacterized protein LOC122579032 n=1 Tax=Erigeron canadensis TaxID=72917 RepID=UPI001CB99B73|nr:uncharacterized protein LOC122579032 [Erigeron canadensis]